MNTQLLLVDGMAAGLVFGINWAGHWFPWRAFGCLSDERGELKRELAYIHGTLSIVIGVALSVVGRVLAGQVTLGAWVSLALLAGHVVAAGLGTLLPRLVDMKLAHRIAQKDAVVYEQAITR